MEQTKKHKVIKVLIWILVIALFIGIIIYLIPLMKQLSTEEGQLQFKEKIDSLGFIGILVLFLLQLAQIALIILPGEPLEILAGMCYGAIGGTVFVFISVFATTTIIYLLVRKYGRKFLYQSFKKEKVDKIENSKAFKNPKTIELILSILFLIPGTPKDLLTYIGALLPVKYLRFTIIATFARFPSVISSTIVGNNIVHGNWGSIVGIYGASFGITAIIIFLVNVFDKSNTTKDALNSLK